MSEFTHFDKAGNAIMVDVSEKKVTDRTAAAAGIIKTSPEVIRAVVQQSAAKGDVLGVARVAGIMAVKQTAAIIPMCHVLLIRKCTIDFDINEEDSEIRVVCSVKTDGKTGVEMEALTGVSVALLTIYDMCKAMDKSMVMTDIHLLEKTGGKSGDYKSVDGR
ncbi:cyclic pyranopterin monophosphate synthase accessory protein [Lachnospiraceae bacterium]|uniref:cyclic pyranopterin monophosphate synthase MoaC n=1 Tax=Extibacter sp. GGCC_0201 TaxID=2731209 RepID=UPI001AA1312F|nr:cyclic pyranopterin monophosphate synthase MoaC [Extibacter sp. GGCC_0201]MBO1721742.1 cyclic pyranopterin monophosphate synthase MoaC [Extibacter sp. GGCC_0201]BDF32469.1 cyclic pyranopterin monophosphate synthase accessory protein [Lachnospiraceae bacterium]BDF36479.1 cyclic pyranopterin monophosphate synthase accessory protein [Lachnospiraceae bacterium]